jgi:hypothetical protein
MLAISCKDEKRSGRENRDHLGASGWRFREQVLVGRDHTDPSSVYLLRRFLVRRDNISSLDIESSHECLQPSKIDLSVLYLDRNGFPVGEDLS